MDKQEIFNKMNLEDQVKHFVGKNFWEIEPIEGKKIFLSDGPHGIRKEVKLRNKSFTVKAICYPAACLSACSFDKDLIYELGQNLAKEAIKNEVDVLLGPGVNIKRNPLCGRNFEYFSEDPYLAGKLAASYINGVQSKNVGVSIKHFALNSQEKARFINSSIVDERTMREIYLKAFEIAVKEAHPWTVMCSYNLVNGVHSSENKHLLTDILRNDFGFDGIVMSDWGAVLNPVKSVEAGLDLEMPGVSKGSEYLIAEAIKNNELDKHYLDESTKRLIKLYERTSAEKVNDFNHDEALKFAKKVNDESIVLLKNEDNILPLNKKSKIALIGDFAKHPRIQGGGSSTINTDDITCLYQEFINEGVDFKYVRGYEAENLKPNKKLIDKAVYLAANSDVVVLMVGLPLSIEAEGYDRENLKMPESQLKLIEEVLSVNENVVIVLQNGSPIEMPFVNDVKGILETYLGGSTHAKSIKDILFGKVNPSGRLAETFPISYEDVASKDYYLKDIYYSLYEESIYVGYRYFDTFNKNVLFPFGYGLSYSDVQYSNLKLEKHDEKYVIKVNVKNNSNIECKEVVQLYVGELNSKIFKAKKELKGFMKVKLAPNEEKEVIFEVNKNDLRYYSNKQQKWCLEKGTYRFYVSKHVNDEEHYVDTFIDSTDESENLRNELSIYYSMDRKVTISEFKKLVNHPFGISYKIRPYTIESPIIDIFKSPLGFMLVITLKVFQFLFVKLPPEKKCFLKALPYQPIRSVGLAGGISKYNIEGIVDILNMHFIRGTIKLLSKKHVIR